MRQNQWHEIQAGTRNPHDSRFDVNEIPHELVRKLEIHLANRNFEMVRHLVDEFEAHTVVNRMKILDSPITAIGLRDSTSNALLTAGIATVRALTGLSLADLDADLETIDEIRTALGKFNLCLRRDENAGHRAPDGRKADFAGPSDGEENRDDLDIEDQAWRVSGWR